MISVIVPVYNTLSHLPCCIDSVLNQTCSDFELLLVDDGSTDGSGALCDQFAERDPRIQVLHQENGGVSAARNAGLAAAKGEYIVFVDADDILAGTYLSSLRDAIETDAALAICNYRRIFSSSEKMDVKDTASRPVALCAEDCAHQLLSARFPISVCCCMFRKTLVGDIRFPVGIHNNEDKLFLFTYLLACKDASVLFLPQKLYGYLVRLNSATTSKWSGSKDIITVADRMYDATVQDHPEWEAEAKLNRFVARFLVLKLVVRSRTEKAEGKAVYDELKEEILAFGWQKRARIRTKVEYAALRIGDWCYALLVRLYYGITSKNRQFRRNEVQTMQWIAQQHE